MCILHIYIYMHLHTCIVYTVNRVGKSPAQNFPLGSPRRPSPFGYEGTQCERTHNMWIVANRLESYQNMASMYLGVHPNVKPCISNAFWWVGHTEGHDGSNCFADFSRSYSFLNMCTHTPTHTNTHSRTHVHRHRHADKHTHSHTYTPVTFKISSSWCWHRVHHSNTLKILCEF